MIQKVHHFFYKNNHLQIPNFKIYFTIIFKTSFHLSFTVLFTIGYKKNKAKRMGPLYFKQYDSFYLNIKKKFQTHI